MIHKSTDLWWLSLLFYVHSELANVLDYNTNITIFLNTHETGHLKLAQIAKFLLLSFPKAQKQLIKRIIISQLRLKLHTSSVTGGFAHINEKKITDHVRAYIQLTIVVNVGNCSTRRDCSARDCSCRSVSQKRTSIKLLEWIYFKS